MRNIKTNTMRMFSLIAAVLSLGLVMAVSPLAASAAEIAENAAVTIAEEIGENTAENAEDTPETVSGEGTAEDAPETVSGEDSVEDTDDSPVTVSSSGFSLIQPIHAHAAEGGTGGASSADSSFKTVIEFFVKWIGRIGGVVAFVGAVMFALAIKNNDAEAKQSALLTMIAGFVAAAVAAASNMFNMFA